MPPIFSRLSGFGSLQLANLPTEIRLIFDLKNTWACLGILLCGFSTYNLLNLSGATERTASIVAIIITISLLVLQALIVNATGLGCSANSNDIKSWRPHPIRIGIFLLIAIIFSQPLLLSIYQKLYLQKIVQNVNLQKRLHNEFVHNALLEEVDKLRTSIAIQNELLNTLVAQDRSPIDPAVSGKPSTAKFRTDSRRKALIIGNQAYPNAPLNSPIKDAVDIASKLHQIGFAVKVINDGNRQDMEFALKQFIEALQPGDISLFYFNGYGFQYHGNNYLAPIDIGNNVSNAVGLNILIEAISRRHAMANVMVIDACRKFSLGNPRGLASIEAGLNNYIAFAAKPGQTSNELLTGANGVFTTALLKHITEQTDIESVFNNVGKDVAQATSNNQVAWSANNLSGQLFLPSPLLETKPQPSNNQNMQTDNSILSGLAWSCLTNGTNISEEASRQFLMNCNQARMLKLQDDLQEKSTSVQSKLEQLNSKPLNTKLTLSDLLNSFYSLNDNPAFLIFGSLLMTILIAGGFIARYYWPSEIIEYEKLIQADNRRFVEEKFGEMRIKASQFKHAPTDILGQMPSMLFKNDASPVSAPINILLNNDAYQAFYDHLAGQPIGGIV